MKKILSVLLSVAMLLTVLPMGMAGTAVSAAGNTVEFAGGSGTAEDPYRVATAEHLNNVRYYLDAHYLQTADIVFTEEDFAMDGPYYNESDGWEPIGNKEFTFTGTYDGNKHSIHNLYINRVSDYVGLFGYVNNEATVTNVYLRNADVYGDKYVGGIIGYAGKSITLTDCYVDGAVSSGSTGVACVGGVVGEASCNISRCYNRATVTAHSGRYVGGIVGELLAVSSGYALTQCVNEGTVAGYEKVGGIAGGSTIFSGNYYQRFQDCVNKGIIQGGKAGENSGLGGICGYGGEFKCCYNIGVIDTPSNYKDEIANYASKTSCYSLSVDGAEALSNKRTFMDWDFETVWTMAGDPDYAYPELRCFTLQGSVAIDGTVAYGETVSVRFINSGNPTDALSFEWYVGGALVSTGETYTITAADVGKKLTARAVSTDCLAAGMISAPQQTVAKAVQPAAPTVPTLQSVNDTGFVLSVAASQEYSIDNVNWQSSGVFGGLEPNQEYAVYSRLLTTDVYLTGDSCEVLRVTTSRRPISGGVAIIGSGRYGETLTADVSAVNTASLSYEWVSGDAVIGTGATYIVTSEDMGQPIALRVIGIGDYTGTLTSAVVTGQKAASGAASAPVVRNKTGSTVTLVTVSGCEYSMDKVNWQDSPVFTGLSPVYTYTFYQRYKATDTNIVGAVSAGTRVTTLKNTVGAPAAPQVQTTTGDSITLVAVYGCQYSKDGINWQDSPTFNGLRSCTAYTFYMRYTETDTTYAGPAGPSVQASTLYTHTYDNMCDPTCNICGAVREVPAHVYDNACDAECNVCGMIRGVGAHVYDNACDTTCNECGSVRSVGRHVYDNDCDTECNICGAVRSVGEHTYVSTVTVAATCGSDGLHTYICSSCGDTYTAVIPATGRHMYDNACDADCNVCAAARVPADHVYSSVCDTNCNVCGLVREVADHAYDNDCDRTCNLCGLIRVVNEHVYDHACDINCNVCGVIRQVAGHVYNHSCDNDCNICGAIRTPAGHTYSNVCDEDCNVCGAVRVPAEHIYSHACDSSCNVCATVRVPADHVYSNVCDRDCNVCGLVREVAGHAYDNACDRTCNLCGAVRSANEHAYDNGCDTDCNACGTVREVAAHVYDNACDTDCNVCGAVRTADEHAYGVEITVANTCGTDGLHTYTCTACGDAYTVVISATGRHSYLNACDGDCNVCGAKRMPAEHEYSNMYDASCNICGTIREVPEIPADAPAFVVDDVRALYGNTFTVAIRTQNNAGLVAFRLNVHYDTELLELISAEEGAFVGTTFGPVSANPFTFTWCDAIHPDNTANDTVVLLTFRAKEGVDSAETVITLSYDADDVYNAAWENVYFNTVSGTVQLTDVTPGDTNGDGKVNVRDLGLLQQYLNGWDVTLTEAAADTNGDGKVNVRDLGLLQQYLNGWDVVLGQPQ